MKAFPRVSDILASACKQNGILRFVICPGSRSAPLVLAFTQYSTFQIQVLNDERSAAYTALGWALAANAPVGIITTSGTAVLNLGPALAEAYYQKLPLFAITADRPEKFIDKNDGQTIRQKNIFKSQIPASFHVKGDIKTQNQFEQVNKTIVKAVDLITKPLLPCPIHLNITFEEPLYLQSVRASSLKIKTSILKQQPNSVNNVDKAKLVQELSQYTSIWLIPGANLNRKLSKQLAKQLCHLSGMAVFTNHLSNWPKKLAISAFDAVLQSKQMSEKLLPKLVITTPGAILSKQLKQILRDNKIPHWHISVDGEAVDTFFSLKKCVAMAENEFYTLLLQKTKGNKHFSETWQKINQTINSFFATANTKLWSDIPAMAKIFEKINEKSIIHLSNSTPVRYAEWALKMSDKHFICHANRGTAGIDGCTSTAAGFSVQTKQDVWLFTGDHAFQYDANALWNKNLSGNLKIVILNNGGGNIFRLIGNTANKKVREQYFEAAEQRNFANLAAHFQCSYYSANSFVTLDKTLHRMLKEVANRPTILELFTNAEQNEHYYFSILNQLKSIHYE